jgi:hypothetical protein
MKSDFENNFSIVIHVKSGLRRVQSQLNPGQMLCLSSTKDFNDLIVATIVTQMKDNKITVKIVRKENIDNIFDRNLIMVELSKYYFDPYFCKFETLRELNDHNFPFKHKILYLDQTEKLPSYAENHQKNAYSENYTYQNHTFNFRDLNDWPNNKQLSLEVKQSEAIQKAVTTDFSLIHGPPGKPTFFCFVLIVENYV